MSLIIFKGWYFALNPKPSELKLLVTGDGGISTIEGVFSLEDPELEELYPLLLTGLLALPPILPRDIDLWLITGEALAEFPLLTCW